ncbi:MAG: (d)CMP kinase [Limnobacter sp.]|nr:(d)CMP kinase [Limnobacter sp.]
MRQRRHRDAADDGPACRSAFRVGADRRREPEQASDAAGRRSAGADGCTHRNAGRATAGAHPAGAHAERDPVRDAGGQRPGQVGAAARGPLRTGRDDGRRTGAHARPYRAHARRFRRRARARRRRSHAAWRSAPAGGHDRRARRHLVGGLLPGRRGDLPGGRVAARARRHEPDAHRRRRHPAADGRRSRGREPARGRRRTGRRPGRARRRAARHRDPAGAGAAGDRRVPGAVRGRRLRRRAHRPDRRRRVARQGIGSDRGHGRRPAHARRACRADARRHRHRGPRRRREGLRRRRNRDPSRSPDRDVVRDGRAARGRPDRDPRHRGRRHLVPGLRGARAQRRAGDPGAGRVSVDPPDAGSPQVPVLAIDGPTASGKGTVAQRVAQVLGWHYLDSGSLYRLVALGALRGMAGVDVQRALAREASGDEPPADAAAGVPAADEPAPGEPLAAHAGALARLAAGLPVVFREGRIQLDGVDVTEAIRAEAVGSAASRIAVLPAVRDALMALQRGFRRAPGLVADGRDMGTVVFPDAALKVFLVASAAARAERRYKQLIEKGISASLSDLLKDLEQRDQRDSTRAVAPLVPAGDALTIDSTALDIDETVERVLQVWRSRERR